MVKVNQLKVTRIKVSTWGAFQGFLASILGLAVAILHSLDSVIAMADATDSVLRGLAFGLATGIISIIVVPLIYFAFGWLIGVIQAWIFNTVLGVSGGVIIDTEAEK